MKGKGFALLQKMGRSFMVPIAILPIAGLFLGLGTAMTSENVITSLNIASILHAGTMLHGFFLVLMKVGNTIFENLPLIFAVAVASGLAKKSKEIAVLSVIVAYIVMHATINGMLIIHGIIVNNQIVDSSIIEGTIANVLGIYSFQMGVFGGIFVGMIVAYLHNRFYKIQLPTALSFFEGERCVPIISTLVFVMIGILVFYIWPIIQNGIFCLGQVIASSGYFGTLAFGIFKRALIPFGLHHVFYLPFWQTALGGSMLVNGVLVQGGQNIFFAQLSDPNVIHFSSEATKYFTGEFIFMIFGLPGAALAMYHTADSENKKKVASLLISATLTCVLTGITEPLEFLFLFAAPLLFGVQVILAGSAYMVAHLFNIAIGLTFSGGLIDFIIFGVLQGNAKTSWLLVLPIGIVYFILYYVIFRTLIVRFNLKTPGRASFDLNEYKAAESAKGFDVSMIDKQSQLIVQGLGGRDNFKEYDCCITRLRVEINDPSKVSQSLLKQSGGAAVVVHGNALQIIYGPKASTIKTKLDEYLSNVPKQYDYEESERTTISKKVALTMITEGEVQPIEEASDSQFASKIMGDGVMIKPYSGLITSPCDGVVTMTDSQKHEVSLLMKNGCELLIHFGTGTEKLNGTGLELLVHQHQSVKQHDVLWNADLNYIKVNAVSENIMMIVKTNDQEVKLHKHYGQMDRKAIILQIDNKG